MNSPDAFALIIGASKCGTTSLFSLLAQLPEICPSDVKEPDFFIEGNFDAVHLEKYFAHWDYNPSIHKYAMEASTSFTKWPGFKGFPERLHSTGLNAKLLYIVRNPFDRILSICRFNLTKGGADNSEDLTKPYYINTSNYYRQLEQYRRYFSREDFSILDFDELRTQPDILLRRAMRFLKLEVQPTKFDIEKKNPTREVSDLEIALIRSPVVRFLNRTGMIRLGTIVPSPVKQGLRLILQAAGKKTQPRQLTDRERNTIRALLQDDMIRFQNEYGIDVSRWGFH